MHFIYFFFGCARPWLQHVASLAVAHGIQFSNQGSSPGIDVLCWEHRVFPTREVLNTYSFIKGSCFLEM